MKRYLLLLHFFCVIAFNNLMAEPPSYSQSNNGIIVFTGTSNAFNLEVVPDNIIRVIVAPGKDLASTQSLDCL